MRKQYGELLKFIMNRKAHVYPAILALVFIVLTVTGVHGWSIGKLYDVFSSTTQGADTALLDGAPRDIRSDEWLVLTPKSIAQYENGLRKTNDNIGKGEDEAIIVDAPTDDFTALFTPQNFGYHFLPLNNAIAFKWQFLSIGLLIVAYYFTLRFFTRKIGIAIALSIILLYAPLIQWTFRSFLIVPIMMGMLALLLSDVMRKRSLKENILYAPALAYVLFAFVLPLYPPFQIGVALSLATFYVIWVMAKEPSMKRLLYSHSSVGIGIVLALCLTGLFYVQNRTAIQTMMSAHFPGVRHFETGKISNNYDLADLYTSGTTRMLNQPLNGDMQDYFQRTGTGNQSEDASVVWIIPPLLVACVSLLYVEWKNRERRILILGALGLQTFVLFIYFVPGLKLPVVSQIQPNRFNAVLLLATFISLGVLATYMATKNFQEVMTHHKKLFYVTVGAWLIHIAIMLISFYKIQAVFGILSMEMAVIALVGLSLFAYHFLYGRPSLSYVILGVLTLFCSFDVNPLYRGADNVVNLPIVRDIQMINKESPGGWFFDGSYLLESLPLLANVPTITTNMSYRQDFWRSIDPKKKYEEVYDRSAHVMGDVSPESKPELLAVNQIKINLDPCDSNLVHKLNIKYIVTVKGPHFSDYISSCTELMKVDHTKTMGDMNIYRIKGR